MTIENIINLIDAKLVNEPKITKVESCTIYPSKVEMGDLFFAVNNSDIDKAVENGAYAIVYEGNIDISNYDNEIAYLQVDSIKQAALKFLRYIAIQKGAKIYLFEPVELSFLKQITSKNTIFTILPDDFQKSFEVIINSDYEIFVTKNEELAKTISSNYLTIEPNIDGYLIEDTLLVSTFKIEKYYYQNREFSPIFFENLKAVVTFCNTHSIVYNINNLRYPKEFKPYYINNRLDIVPKSLSEKVVIFFDNLEYIYRAYNYLKEQKSWTKSIVITPHKTKIDLIDKPIWFKDINEAKMVLKKSFYNFAFCYQLEAKDVLKSDDNQPKLFV